MNFTTPQTPAPGRCAGRAEAARQHPAEASGVTNVTVSAWVSAVIRVACCTWVSRTWPMASQTSSVLNLRVAPGCVAGEVTSLALLIRKRKAYNVTCTQPLNNCHSTLVYFLFFYLPESLFVWLYLNCTLWEFSFLSGLMLGHLTMD